MANYQEVSDKLFQAIRDGNEEIVRELINTYGLSYSDEWNEGYDLLFEALDRKQRIVANILLYYGCKVNDNSYREEETPLHLAVENDFIEIVNTLLFKGADIEAKDNKGWTPLHYAAAKGHYEVAELLLRYKANINIHDFFDQTPLHYAALEGHYEVAKLLLKHKADLNVKDEDGSTPLYHALFNNQYDVVELLLMHKADINEIPSDVRAALKRSIVKLKTANLYDNEVNLPLMDVEINEFQNKCKEEIIKMKNQKIKNTNITFYDILTKLNKNTTWMKNKNVVDALKTEDYKKELPLYSKLIADQFKRGIERNQLLEPSFEVCRSLFNNLNPLLPDECVEKVLNYLSNEELEILLPSSKVLCS